MGGTSFDIALTKEGKTDIVKDFNFIRYRDYRGRDDHERHFS
jgi:N-methylhydantoinase A/oxoprolinase/acetone carboxylase beta subunit